MAHEHEKSGTTILLDAIRNILILIATGGGIYLLWQWHWLVAILAAIPIYIVMLNLFGFLTLPLYMLTPENRLIARASRAFQNGNFEEGKTITGEFAEKFKVNVAHDEETRE